MFSDVLQCEDEVPTNSARPLDVRRKIAVFDELAEGLDVPIHRSCESREGKFCPLGERIKYLLREPIIGHQARALSWSLILSRRISVNWLL